MAKALKTTINIQYEGTDVTDKQIIDRIKKDWLEAGNLVKDIDSLDIYVKPAEGIIYYVINETTYELPMSDI